MSGENINHENDNTKQYDRGENDDENVIFLGGLIFIFSTTFFTSIFPSKVDGGLSDQVPDRDRVTTTGLRTWLIFIERHEHYQYLLNIISIC